MVSNVWTDMVQGIEWLAAYCCATVVLGLLAWAIESARRD